ncbi:hypothetical protein E1140_16470 [Fulvivirga lutimaris]|nr:hypothetical protein [Fulvivirga lutimaris]
MYPLVLQIRIFELMKYLFSTLLLGLSLTLFAQNKPIEIIGEILDPETNEAVPYVHVVNLRTNQGFVSNTEGRFWINMAKEDTLMFSAIGFEKYHFTLKENVTTDKLIVTIELRHSTLELETVKVFAFKDEHALKRALIDAKVPLQDEKPGLKIPGVKIYRSAENGGLAIGGPLTAIGNLFSKEHKEQKKLIEVSSDYDFQKVIRAKYNETIVMKVTGIPEDKVEDFMKFCKIEDSFISRASEYELTVVIQQCFTDFTALDLKEDN